MSKHTPGPWVVDFSRDSNGVVDCDDAVAICTSDDHNLDVCAVWNDIPEGSYEANANLIAAAPELLAALHEALPFVNDDDGAYKNGYAKKVEQRILAAINKAEGKA